MPDASIPSLPTGTLVLNRFEVVEFAHDDALALAARSDQAGAALRESAEIA